LIPQKDFPTLLAAFAGVLTRRPDARLAILGDGPERANLHAEIDRLMIRDQVRMLGFTKQVGDWMSRAEVFVLSSSNEGFGNVLVEAMHAGAKVVSTDCPSGPREILEDGRWGRLVPVGDVGALTDALVDSLADHDPPDVVQRAAAFTPDLVVDRYVKVLFSQLPP
jgi:glycosyltransferase involved in cell wall biosynthesis